MKKFFIPLVILELLIGVARGQQNTDQQNSPISNELILKMANHTLTKADSDLLKKRVGKLLKIDTVFVRFRENGLQEKNKRADSLALSISSCSFEKDANAMVLYDLGQMAGDATGMRVERHKRIKIFNESGKSAATIRIDYTNQFGAEQIEEVEGRTLNFNNDTIEYTDLDPRLVYREMADKYHGSIVFSMPNVKPGSVIEIGYVWRRTASMAIPGWDFQTNIPTLYSQYVVQLYRNVKFNSLERTSIPLAKDSSIFNGFGHVWAMTNVPALKNEPFARSRSDGLQSVELVVTSALSTDGQFIDVAGSWSSVGRALATNKEFNKTFDQDVNDRLGLVKQARLLSGDDARVRFLFGQVKTLMKWNGEKYWASKDGIKKAWENKSGNWGEINMVLCRLLNESGVKAYPMLASTRDNGKMYNNFVNLYQPNKLVTYVPIDSARYYVLDASGKYNNCDEVPFDLLNSYGLSIDNERKKYSLVFLKDDNPVKQQVSIDAEIKPDGTMAGSAQINSFGYNKSNALQLHALLDEKKYNELLTGNDNDLRILSLKFENAEIDSLPLVQDIGFKLDLPGTDEKYIYFNPNLFTGLHINPFVSEHRFSDIDFGCNNLLSINGKYKIPVGYKIESIPQAQTLTMPDRSIIFKRIALEQDGYIIVYYVINYKRSFFPQSDYMEIYNYFKKMNTILNEPIVLKKS